MAIISIEVDSDTAKAFAEAAEEERRKLELLLALRLRELTSGPIRPLREIMDNIGANAKARGLTPELLGSLLRDES
jgi:ferritin-like protein